MDEREMARYERREVIPVAGPKTLAPEATAAPRTLEAVIADLEKKLEDLCLEKQEWEHERSVYQDERTKLMAAFDEQRQAAVKADDVIEQLQARVGELEVLTGQRPEPGAVV